MFKIYLLFLCIEKPQTPKQVPQFNLYNNNSILFLNTDCLHVRGSANS